MKQKIFDVLMIIAIAGFCLLFYSIDNNKAAGFLFLPILAFYFAGRYSERKFGEQTRKSQ